MLTFPAFACALPQAIQDVMAELVPERQEYAKKIKSELGDKTIGDIKVEHVFGTRLNCLRSRKAAALSPVLSPLSSPVF